jgi:MFS family permease
MNEFRRGWPLLLGSFIGIATGISSLYFYSFGLFLKPVAADYGWSRGAASLGPLLGTLGAALAAAPAGQLMDRIGPRRVATVSMLLLAAAFASLGIITNGLFSFLAIATILSILAVGSSPLSYTRIVIGAFDKHRGLALGLALTGTGVGATLAPLALTPLIAMHGWRTGYLVLAMIVLIATVPVSLLLGRHEKTSGTPVTRQSAGIKLSSVIAEPGFTLLAGAFFLAAAGVLGSVVHFPAMLSDAGLSASTTGMLTGLIGIAVIAGRATTGLLLDRVPAHMVAAAMFGLSAVGISLLAIEGANMAIPGAIALGLSVGAEADLVAYLVSRLFPQKIYGSAYGGVYAMFLLGSAIGPALIGVLFDLSGGYTLPFSAAALCLMVAALLILRLHRYTERATTDLEASAVSH